jgi:phage-related protein
MIDRTKRLQAQFFQTASGSEPVRAWLKDPSSEDRKIVGKNIAKVEFGWPIGMPYCRVLGNGLWEIRSGLSQGRIGRVFFCIVRSEMILLRAFIKKSQRTPDAELKLARRRMKEIIDGQKA